MNDLAVRVARKIVEESIRSHRGYEGALRVLEDVVVGVVGVAVRTDSSPLHRQDFRAVLEVMASNALAKYKSLPDSPQKLILPGLPGGSPL